MRRRTFLAALGVGSAGLAGCTGDQDPTKTPTDPPQAGTVETEFTFENGHAATWVLDATFVDQPFAGVEVTRLDGSSQTLDDATTTEDVFDGVGRPEHVTSVSFGDVPTATVEGTVPSGDAVSETVGTWSGAGLIALLHREDAADDPDFRAFVHTSCMDDAPVIDSVRLAVDADNVRSMQGQCGQA